MKQRNTITLLVVAAILIFALVALFKPLFGRTGMQLGLDLKGGVYLEYQAQFPEDTSLKDEANLLKRATDIIRTRVDKFGVTEPLVQSLGTDRLVVQLPGFTNIDEAKKLVEQTGFLEFREVELNANGNPVFLSDYLNQAEPVFFNLNETGKRFFVDDKGNILCILQQNDAGQLVYSDINGSTIEAATLKEGSNASVVSWIAARGDDGNQLTGQFLLTAEEQLQTGAVTTEPVVKITWDKEGTTIFDQVARRLYVRPQGSLQRDLGIFLDNTLISAPEILVQQYGGVAVIQGSFTTETAKRLAIQLSSGSLPMPLQKPPIYEDTISASLGANFTNMSVQAGIIGTLLVMLFMIVYYRIPGVMAALSLMFYAVSLLAVFKLWPVTLSLAGIGGFVLSVGMAVDANVIIFERLKEELRGGRTLGAAIEAGFDRAWLAIRDSNITTIIACVILYMVGNAIPSGQPVKGFAITLGIGVLFSMFSAITVTRGLLRLFVGTSVSKNISLFSVWSGRK